MNSRRIPSRIAGEIGGEVSSAAPAFFAQNRPWLISRVSPATLPTLEIGAFRSGSSHQARSLKPCHAQGARTAARSSLTANAIIIFLLAPIACTQETVEK